MTGRYSYIQGNGERAPQGLESQLRPDDTVFPEYLKASGYVARQVGKCHVGTKKYEDAFRTINPGTAGRRQYLTMTLFSPTSAASA